MEHSEKYLPKTALAVASLKETISQLQEISELSVAQNQELSDKLTNLRKQVSEKAACIDNIINTLNGALK